jgi:ligand-binding sensor domain-containing protein
VTALAASPDDGTIWIGTSRGLWRTEEAGHAAAPVALPVPVAPEITAVASNGLGGLDVRALAVSPTDGRLHAAVRGKGLFRSRTQARFWHFAEAGPVGSLYGLASVNLPTGMGGIFLYASTDQGLLRSADCF